jgi:HK97 family phage major capsid protein
MSAQSIALRQKRAAIVQNMHDLTEATSFPAESEKRWKELDLEQKAIESQINAMEATEKLHNELRESKNGHKETAQPGGLDTIRADAKLTKVQRAHQIRATEEYNTSFDRYIRTGRPDELLEEVRTYAGLEALVGNSTGEFIVPVGFQKELEIKLKAYGGMRNVCRIINTSTGNPLQWPTMDDTANDGEWLAEATTIGQVNPSFNRITFTANVASSKQVLVSVQLLQDSAFDVQSMLSEAMGIRLGRRVNIGYTTGSGSGDPDGIVTALIAFNGGSQLVTAVGANGTNNPGATTLNSVNLIDDLDALITKVDPAYRAGAKFMANQSTLDTFRKQKDGFGRTLWNVSVSEDEPDTLYGYGYQWNQSMAALGAAAHTVLFGNFEHYVIRDVGPVTFFVFQETYMANLQKGFQAFLRTDGQLLQPVAFSLLTHPAS